MADIIGGGTPNTSNAEYWNGEIDWYAPAEITDQIYVDSSERKITKAGYDNSSAKMLPVGTVLFTSRAGIGKMVILRKESCTNQGFQSIVPRVNKLDSYFIFSRSEELKRYGETVGAGSTFVEVSAKQMAAMNILLPPTIDEQKKIGAYFSNLDHLITLHQRKYYVLGFVHIYDWEQRKLSEMADKVSEKNKNNEYNEPLTNSAEQGIISQKDYFDREVVNKNNLDGYYIVRENDFVYNPRVSVSAPVGPINRNKLGRNGVMSPLYTVFRTHDIDAMYLDYYYKTTKWHRFMKLNGDSGARFDRFTISSTLFMEMPIPYPRIEEQRKIGTYFDTLDHLITLHQRKYKSVKKIHALTKTQRKAIKILIKILLFIGKILYNRWKL